MTTAFMQNVTSRLITLNLTGIIMSQEELADVAASGINLQYMACNPHDSEMCDVPNLVDEEVRSIAGTQAISTPILFLQLPSEPRRRNACHATSP